MRSPQIEKLPFKEVYNMRPENLSPQSPNRSRSTNGKSRIFKYQHGSNSQVRQQNNNRPYNAVPTSPTFIQGSADIRGIRKSINNGSRVIGYENINNIPSHFSYTEVNQNTNNNGAASNISYIERLQTEFDGNRHLHTTQNEQKIAQNHMQAEKKSNIKINYMTPTTSEYFRPIVTYSTGSKIRSTTAAQIPLIKHIPVGQLVSGYNNNQPAQPVMATTTITRKPQTITDLSKTSAIIGATNDKNKVIDFDNNANLKNIQIHLQPQSNMMFSPGSELSKAEKAQQHKFISHTIQCSKTPSEIPQSIFSNNISMMPVHAYRPAPTSIGVNTNEVGRLSSIVITNRDGKIMQNKQELVIAGIQPEQQNQVGSSLRYEFKIRTNEMAGNEEANDKLPIKVSNSSEMPTVTSSLRYHKINPDNSISSSAANSSIRLMNVNNNYNAVNSSNSVTKNAVTTNCGKNSPRYVYNGYSTTTANLTKSNQAVSELKNTNTQVNKNAIQLTSSNSNEIIKSIPNSFSNPTAVCKPPFTQNQNMNAQFVKRQLGRNFMSSFPSNLSANEQSTSNQNNPIHTIGVSNNISFDIQNNPFALSTPSTHQNKSGSMDVSQVRRIQHIPVQITSKKDNAIVEMQCQPLSNQLSQVSQSISFPQPHTITQIYRPSSNNPIYSRTITKVHPQPVASYTTIRPLTPYGKQYTIPSHYQLSSQIKPQLHYQFEERPTYVSASRQHSQPPDSLLQPLQLDFMDYVQKNRNNRYKTDIQQMRNQAIQPKRQPQIPQYSSYIQSAIPSSYIPSYSGINSRPEFNNRIIYSNSAYPQKHSQDSAIKLDRRGAQTDRQKKDEVENNSRSRSRSRSRVNIFDFVKDPNRQSRFSHQVISSKAKKQEEIKFQPHTVLSPKNVKHEKYEPRHNYRISIASNESGNKDKEENIQKNLRIPQQPGEKNRMSSENEESSNQQDRKSKWRQRLSRDKIKRFFSRSKGKEVNNEKEKRNNNDNEKQEDQQKQEEGQDFEQGEEQGQRGEGKQRKGKWRNRVKGFFGKARGKKGESEQKSKQNQQQDDNDNESQQQEQQSKWRSKLSTNPIKGLIHKIRGNKDKKDKTQGQQEQAQEDDNEKDNDNQNKQGQSRWRDKFSRKKIKGLFSRSHGKEDKNTKAQQKKDRNEQEGEEEDGKEKGKWRKKVKGLINKVRRKDEVGDHQKKANQKQKNDKKNQKQKSEKSKEKKGKQLVSIKSAQNNKNDAKQADGNVSDDENSGGWKRYFDESVQGVIKRLDTVGTTVKQLLAPKKQQPQSKYQTWKTQKGQQSPLPRNIDRRLTIRDEFGTNYLKSPQQYSSPPQISADFDQMNELSLSDIKQKDDVMNRSSSSRGAHKTKKQSEQKKVSKSNKTLGNQQQRNQDMKGKAQQKKEGLSFLEIFMIAGLIGIGVAMVMFQILR